MSDDVDDWMDKHVSKRSGRDPPDDDGPEIPFQLEQMLERAQRILTQPAYLEDASLQRRHFVEFAREAYQVPQFPIGLVTELFGELAEGLNISEAALIEAREPKANGHDPDPLEIDLSKFDPPKEAKPGLHSPAALSLEDWLKRDLPPPDFLLGNWLTTTSRVFMYGPTGLGKTMIGLAIAMPCAAGMDFLHWRGVRPCRVLFIDGEMSSRLLKQRLADEVARLGVAPVGFRALSHEDIENFQPLNTPAGQAQIENEIKAMGGADLIVFDNVMSLISGDQKDEESWRQTLPWIRSLTKRSIGQFWVHHTGHDEGHSYGTKTREWQMDTVIRLEKLDGEEQGDNLSFKFIFSGKARERTPATRADFADVKITLAGDVWMCDAAGARRTKASPLGLKFLEALRNATIGNKATKMYGCPTASIAEWGAECIQHGIITDVKEHTDRTMFAKYRRELIAANRIACNDTMAWTLR